MSYDSHSRCSTTFSRIAKCNSMTRICVGPSSYAVLMGTSTTVHISFTLTDTFFFLPWAQRPRSLSPHIRPSSSLQRAHAHTVTHSTRPFEVFRTRFLDPTSALLAYPHSSYPPARMKSRLRRLQVSGRCILSRPGLLSECAIFGPANEVFSSACARMGRNSHAARYYHELTDLAIGSSFWQHFGVCARGGASIQ